jgi:AcrR family transcriptional regulator
MRHRDTHSREEILERTIQIIEHHGEAAVRVKDLCDEVGVAVTSLYHFFDNREGLIEAAQVERYERELRRAADDIADHISACRTQREFRSLVRRLLDMLCAHERAGARLNRINVIGSVQGRPDLERRIGAAQTAFHHDLAAALELPQQRGWIRRDLDLAALTAWFFGQITSRILIEIGDSDIDGRAWNRMATEAITAVMFGEVRSIRSAA